MCKGIDMVVSGGQNELFWHVLLVQGINQAYQVIRFTTT